MDAAVSTLCDMPSAHRLDPLYGSGVGRKSPTDSLSFQVRRLNKALGYRLRQLFEAQGVELSVDQWMILTALNTQQGVNQMQVGDMCFRDKASITRLLDIMEAKQWVYRQIDTRDRRIKLVFLTPEGAEVRAQALAIAWHLERELGRMLGSTEQLNSALHTLTRFGDYLDKADPD
jgi:DNA-binding MarR family transcriptional regulator